MDDVREALDVDARLNVFENGKMKVHSYSCVLMMAPWYRIQVVQRQSEV